MSLWKTHVPLGCYMIQILLSTKSYYPFSMLDWALSWPMWYRTRVNFLQNTIVLCRTIQHPTICILFSEIIKCWLEANKLVICVLLKEFYLHWWRSWSWFCTQIMWLHSSKQNNTKTNIEQSDVNSTPQNNLLSFRGNNNLTFFEYWNFIDHLLNCTHQTDSRKRKKHLVFYLPAAPACGGRIFCLWFYHSQTWCWGWRWT